MASHLQIQARMSHDPRLGQIPWFSHSLWMFPFVALSTAYNYTLCDYSCLFLSLDCKTLHKAEYCVHFIKHVPQQWTLKR